MKNPDKWIPNIQGGRENLEAINLLKTINASVSARHPGACMIAEESKSWPLVSKPTDADGLGFHFKWNMGRMPGEDRQPFANLRMLLAMMYGHPGEKLLFMGGEFGQHGQPCSLELT